MLAKTATNIAKRLTGLPSLPQLLLLLRGQARSTHLRHREPSRDNMKSIMLRSPVESTMAFAGLLNQEARALEADGVDVIQFGEPAFNVFMDEVAGWGIEALHRAIDGLKCTTAVHICYGYGIKANIDWKNSLGGEWKQN